MRVYHGKSKTRAAFVPPEPGLVEMLVDTLVWVRKNYGGGSTTEINGRIDAAIAKAIGPATGRRRTAMTSATHEELLGDAPIEPHLRELMTDLAADLDTLFNPGQGAERMVGFVLLVFPLEGCEGLVNYISNTNRAEVVTLLKEQLARFSKQDVDQEQSAAPEGRRWRHVTSGMSVTEIGRGRMQTAEPIGDMTPVVIYHHAGEHGGGTFWVRPAEEFEDRFVEPPPPLAETEEQP